MDNEHRELLSALMDGEISELELRRLLKHGGEQVEGDWARMHAVRRVLRDGDTAFADLDISGGVSAALTAMPAPRTARSAWLRPLAGLAIAASVAAIVVLGGGNLPGTQPTARPEVASAPLPTRIVPPGGTAAATGSVTANASAASTAVAVPDSVARARFRQHMLRHTQRAVDNSGHGVFSYARVVYEVND